MNGIEDQNKEVFSKVISSYTRVSAIEDGVLVDLTALYPNDTRLFKCPVACTATVWGLIERACKKNPGGEGARVGDLCWMSINYKIKVFSESEHLFKCRIGRKACTFKINCGPGNDGDPVITLMMPDED